MKSVLSFILSIMLSVTNGCGAPAGTMSEKTCRVVTEISIVQDDGFEIVQRQYQDQHKMNKALACLRKLEPWARSCTDPEQSHSPICNIELRLSDGSSRSYTMADYRHLSVNGGPWWAIDPEDGHRFPLLTAAVPSDKPAGNLKTK